ncbi:MAG: dephospho-CoA kinase [Desulfovibrio sp.]|nr:dephospho-CoA kinase [Desulfovibrio sp.]
MASFQFTIDQTFAGQRLDLFLAKQLPSLSRSWLKQLIVEGCCLVCGLEVRRPDQKLKLGQVVALNYEEKKGNLVPCAGDLELIYEDQDLVVVNKPANLTVHPCPSCNDPTLIQQLLRQYPKLALMEGQRPGVVQRLDKQTSGLLVVALREQARLQLSQLFALRKIHKEYLAIVYGCPPKTGSSKKALGRDPHSKVKMAVLDERFGGKSAHSEWEVLWSTIDQGRSLLKVRIYTGRTHQIRVHLADLGYPILGDQVYAKEAIAALAPRQMLHAWKLSFEQPSSGELLSFSAPPPADFRAVLEQSCHFLQKVVLTGNPGSGKSTVTDYFRKQSYPCFSADLEVAKLYAPGGEVAEWLLSQGQAKLIDQDGAIKRAALFQAFREERAFKENLEEIIHAWVKDLLNSFWEKHKNLPMAFAEIPLFFECGWSKDSAKNQPSSLLTVAVHCPQAERFERLKKSRNWSLDKAMTIESWQWPEAKKKAACDYVLDNSGDLKKLSLECQKLDRALKLHYAKSLDLEKEKLKTILDCAL